MTKVITVTYAVRNAEIEGLGDEKIEYLVSTGKLLLQRDYLGYGQFGKQLELSEFNCMVSVSVTDVPLCQCEDYYDSLSREEVSNGADD